MKLLLVLVASWNLVCLGQTHSDRYKKHETDSPERTRFIHEHNHKARETLEASPNYIPVQNMVYRLLDGEKILKTVAIDGARSLKLVERGLGRETDLVLVDGKSETILVSNFQVFGVKIVDSIVDFKLSPDQRWVSIVFALHGSIDQMKGRIYDLRQRKLLPTVIELAENDHAWSSPTKILYPKLNPDLSDTFSEFNVETLTTSPVAPGWIISDPGQGHLLLNLDQKNVIRDQKLGTDRVFTSASEVKDLIAVNDQAYTIWTAGANGKGEVRVLSRSGAPGDEGTLLFAGSDLTFRSVSFNQDNYFVKVRKGGDRWFRVFDSKGSQLAELPAPDCCSVLSVEWADPAARTQLKATLRSHLVAKEDFVYDLTTKAWNRDPATTMLTLDGVQYFSTVEYVISNDGTRVPVRLTYRANLPKNKANPALIKSYGGFNLSGYLDPYYDPILTEFIKLGGILAGTGLRGGNEFDEPWHQAAIKEGKGKTYEDLSAVSRYLTTEGWTTVPNITSMGTSNGGLTVAATALLYPDHFGLVVPIGGVHDLLGKDRMDKRFGGWDYEYGSASDPALLPLLSKISPVEISDSHGDTEFLIIDGKEDTRVNIAHSLKLANALDDQTQPHGPVNLLSVKKAGHWVESGSYSNLKALEVQTAVCTRIFDRAGWKLESGG